MIGAIIGDIVGSRFEFNNHRSKDFELFTDDCFFTDDTIMTIAVADALAEYKKSKGYGSLSSLVVDKIVKYGKRYPDAGYGRKFESWLYSKDHLPYNSFGNGAAMRVSACACFDEDNCYRLARIVTETTHNHPEGVKGALATVRAIKLAQAHIDKEKMLDTIKSEYGYDFGFTLEELISTNEFNETCQVTVPQAIRAFYESNDFEDAIRNAVSIGGDSDTIACIAGAIAEAYYGIPTVPFVKYHKYLDLYLKNKLYDAVMAFKKNT